MSERPLSPHLQIYRWQITSVLSILHRGSGIALAAATPLYVLWLVSVALGDASFALVRAGFASWPGQAVLVACSFAGTYHLFNGLRHLLWDMGVGFSPSFVARSGVMIAYGSLALTCTAWTLVWLTHG